MVSPGCPSSRYACDVCTIIDQAAVRKMLKALMFRSHRISPESGAAGQSGDTSGYMKVAVISASSLLSQKHCFRNQPPPPGGCYFLSAEVAVVTSEAPVELRLSYAADDTILNRVGRSDDVRGGR